jgi:hypothetical protein
MILNVIKLEYSVRYGANMVNSENENQDVSVLSAKRYSTKQSETKSSVDDISMSPFRIVSRMKCFPSASCVVII